MSDFMLTRGLASLLCLGCFVTQPAIAAEPVAQVRCARPELLNRCAQVTRGGRLVDAAVSQLAVHADDIVTPLAGKAVVVRYAVIACGEEWLTQSKAMRCVPPAAGAWGSRVKLNIVAGTTTRGASDATGLDHLGVLWPPDRSEWLDGSPLQVYVPPSLMRQGLELHVRSDDSDFRKTVVLQEGWQTVASLPVAERLAWSLHASSGQEVSAPRSLRVADAERSRQLRQAVAAFTAAQGWQGPRAALAWVLPDVVGTGSDLAAVALAQLRATPLPHGTDVAFVAAELLAFQRFTSDEQIRFRIDDGQGGSQSFSWSDAVAGRAEATPFAKGRILDFVLDGVEPGWSAAISFLSAGQSLAIRPGEWSRVVPALGGERFRRSGNMWEVDGQPVHVCWTLGTALRHPVQREQQAPSEGQVRGCVALR